MTLSQSELILNPDGSVYHLKLQPDQIADTIITVGDPERVDAISQYFDRIDVRVASREFVTHSGELNGKRLTVISTGIGTDNIDIVLNELDALANIDLKTRSIKSILQSLNIIRIGTSGSLHSDIPCDSFVLSAWGLGMDGLLPFYQYEDDASAKKIFQDIDNQINITAWQPIPSYIMPCGQKLLHRFFEENQFKKGITATCTGFYAPQGRRLRAQPKVDDILDKLANYKHNDGLRITNFEMETAGIYGMANLLGHQALSCNAILANRPDGRFSSNPQATVTKLIESILINLTKS